MYPNMQQGINQNYAGYGGQQMMAQQQQQQPQQQPQPNMMAQQQSMFQNQQQMMATDDGCTKKCSRIYAAATAHATRCCKATLHADTKCYNEYHGTDGRWSPKSTCASVSTSWWKTWRRKCRWCRTSQCWSSAKSTYAIANRNLNQGPQHPYQHQPPPY
ncbi:hypothetical protein QAD02_000995 [Eretmocerus hayati]|uniref:Uncharacterized protein n=1 Tax=Eretmocerus hayati TaxID=131215 RepID=A0ACC2NFR3_9HYME|nr:hypothetical protein QAD02_000995 [Eretmocerus hayati]